MRFEHNMNKQSHCKACGNTVTSHERSRASSSTRHESPDTMAENDGAEGMDS